MQLQQLHGELRKLRRDLEESYEAREDLQDELKEMTQMYLNVKQERDKYKQHMELVRKDVENIERIVKENVERAMRGRDKQMQEMMQKFNLQQERITQLEAHKECYANTINSLEKQLEETKNDLAAEQEKSQRLSEQLLLGGGGPDVEDPYSIAEEKARLKRLQREDDNYFRKVNDADNGACSANFNPAACSGYQTNLDQTAIEDGNKENQQTTQFDGEDSADEHTNVRLKEDNSHTMIFDFNHSSSNMLLNKVGPNAKVRASAQQIPEDQMLNLSHVKVDVRRSAQFDGKIVRPGSSEGSSGSDNRQKSTSGSSGSVSAKKPSFGASFLGSASKAASRVTPFNQYNK